MKKLLFCLLLLYSSISFAQFSPYTPAVDVNLYERTLQNKQARYDENIKDIKRKIADVQTSIDYLSDISTSNGELAQNSLDDYLRKISKIAYDYGDDRIYSQVIATLESINKSVKSYTRNYLKQTSQNH